MVIYPIVGVYIPIIYKDSHYIKDGIIPNLGSLDPGTHDLFESAGTLQMWLLRFRTCTNIILQLGWWLYRVQWFPGTGQNSYPRKSINGATPMNWLIGTSFWNLHSLLWPCISIRGGARRNVLSTRRVPIPTGTPFWRLCLVFSRDKWQG